MPCFWSRTSAYYLRPTGYILRQGQSVTAFVKFLSKRGLSKDLSTPQKRIPRSVDRLIKTLRPEKMVEVGQKPNRITTPIHNYCIREGQQLLRLYVTDPGSSKSVALPKHRPGVFYYHREPGLPEIAGYIRYRICDDVAKFHEGQDLVLRHPCIPWSQHVYRAIRQDETREGLGSLLLQEKLVHEDTIVKMKRVFEQKTPQRCLFRLDQPFYFDVSQQKMDCAFVTEDSLDVVHFMAMRDHRLEPPLRMKSPYTGVARARFELSNLPEHRNLGPTIVLRILETLTPIECIIPNYDNYWAKPEAGELIHVHRFKTGKGKPGRYDPWKYRLDTQRNGEKLKQFIRKTSPEVYI